MSSCFLFSSLEFVSFSFLFFFVVSSSFEQALFISLHQARPKIHYIELRLSLSFRTTSLKTKEKAL